MSTARKPSGYYARAYLDGYCAAMADGLSGIPDSVRWQTLTAMLTAAVGADGIRTVASRRIADRLGEASRLSRAVHIDITAEGEQ